GTYARTIELGVSRELELKGPRAGIAARAFRHHLRRLGTESEGREERRERGQPRELPYARAREPGFELPERAIHGVARAARRQQRLELGTRRPGLDGLALRGDLLAHRVRGFAEVIDAGGLAAT